MLGICAGNWNKDIGPNKDLQPMSKALHTRILLLQFPRVVSVVLATLLPLCL